jgi:hypothetical protein
MDHSVRVEQLPDGIVFPPEMADRVRYDSSTRTLSFRGFMSKAEFDRLSRLHDDWGYRRSLEELFRLCTLDPGPTPTNRLASVFARLIPGRERSRS